MDKITISALCAKEIGLVWKAWTNPEHIIHWTFASPDWHSPRAESDLRAGGRFLTRMEAKDGSAGFDFEGTFLTVEEPGKIVYRMDDGREVEIVFEKQDNKTLITEIFDPENIHPAELQKQGWQSILDNFVRYAESL